mgnify:CR=1 FL=1
MGICLRRSILYDKGVEDYRILKFLLQPIVENSILHAFREDGLHQLTLRIYKKENCLMVVIGDNGKGFSIEKQMEKTFSIKQYWNKEYTGAYIFDVWEAI